MDSGLTAQFIVYAIISLVVSLVIHEFTHAYVGHLLGDTTAQEQGRLSLNPLKHVDPFMTIALPILTLLIFGAPVLAAKPVPFNPDRVKFDEFGAALIAAAGPFANLVLAVAGALVFHGLHGVGTFASFLDVFVTLNVALFVFNLIPIPPLDGSRVLYAFAPEPLQDVMRAIEPYGLFIIFGLILLGDGSSFLANLDQAILNILP